MTQQPRRKSVYESVAGSGGAQQPSRPETLGRPPTIPEVTPDLVEHLERSYPPIDNRYNHGTTTHDDVMFWLGQRSVIATIRYYLQRQTSKKG